MNKFIKFPLVLGAVGIICGAALGTVYEVTKGPIADAEIIKVDNTVKAVSPDYDNKVDSTSTFGDAAARDGAGITTIYTLSKGGSVIGYAYVAETMGFADTIKYIAVIDSNNTVFKGFKVVKQTETKKGTLQDKDLGKQFENTDIYSLDSEITYVAGASTSMKSLLSGMNNLVNFHTTYVLGDVSVLSKVEMKTLGLTNDDEVVDCTEDLLTKLGGDTSKLTKTTTNETKAKDENNTSTATIEKYIQINNGGALAKQGFIVKADDSAYGGTVKYAYLFDKDWKNGQFTILSDTSSGDSITDSLNSRYDEKNMSDLKTDNSYDGAAGATLISLAVRDSVQLVVDVCTEAFK